jgi:hypothetical protein
MIWVAGRSPTLVSQNLKATTLTYLAIHFQAGNGPLLDTIELPPDYDWVYISTYLL